MGDERAGWTISDAEWDLLETLWERGPTTARGAAEALESERGWAYSTVKTMLDRMVEKKLISARQVGNVWEYTALVEPEEARRSAWRRFVEAAFGGASASALQFVVSEARLSRKQREDLLNLLKNKE
ncbi:MAG: BlaI/MecI/CopY family transcriptional regulator [Phycisphaerales bacterium]